MYCSNCGRFVREEDNFCRFCGLNLKSQNIKEEPVKELQEIEYDGEELVLYEVNKHWMALFWPAFLAPIFLVYFWTVFLNTHSFLSWIIVFAFLFSIIYPTLKYKSDKIVITTKAFHITLGVLKKHEIEIPLKKANIINVTQSSMGKALNYGTISFCINSEKFEYPYIVNPEVVDEIISNPNKFVNNLL